MRQQWPLWKTPASWAAKVAVPGVAQTNVVITFNYGHGRCVREKKQDNYLITHDRLNERGLNRM